MKRISPASARPSAWMRRTAATIGTEADLLVDAWRERAATPEQKRRIMGDLHALARAGRSSRGHG